MEEPLIRMTGITKGFPGVLALNGIDLEVHRGEIHAICGENGSGKSTLMKCLYGQLLPDSGSIYFQGREVLFRSPAEAIEVGICAITQELTLAPTLSVTENILMGRLPTRGPLVNWSLARERAKEVLDTIGAGIDPDSIVGDLSVELRQEVEIARALAADPCLLILDEPTSSLSEDATSRLFVVLERLRNQGVAVLLISHRLKDLYACATKATILRDGMHVGELALPAAPESELVRRMVGREISELYGKTCVREDRVVMCIEDLSTEDGRVRNVSLQLHRGEVLGVAGLVGSGKTELGLALFGAIPSTGRVQLNGIDVTVSNPEQALEAGIGLVPEDRRRSAIFPQRSVRHNISLGWLGFLTRCALVDNKREHSLVDDVMEDFAIKARPEDTIAHLSGGNQQKVVLARWFKRQPKVMILTEPTRGIDLGAKAEVYRVVQDLARTGAGIILISSELPELIGIADRVITMFRGELCGEFNSNSVAEYEIAHACLGGHEETGVRE